MQSCWSTPEYPPTTGTTFRSSMPPSVLETRSRVVSIRGLAPPNRESVRIPASPPLRPAASTPCPFSAAASSITENRSPNESR